MNWKTKITELTEKGISIRGYEIEDITKNLDFAQTIFLTLSGKIPTEQESIIFNNILTMMIDHGPGPSSANATRTVASTGSELNASVAAGILAINKKHGGAIQDCMEFLTKTKNVEETVKHNIENKIIIPGFGHRVYKDTDPRTRLLINKLKELNINSEFVNKAIEIEKQIEKIKGKKLVINIDGIVAAILCELKFPINAANGLFMIARIPGLVAHALEEKEENTLRNISEEDIEYIGERNKKINQ